MINSVILAGGFGSRISEETISQTINPIGQKPIIWFIMTVLADLVLRTSNSRWIKVEMIKEYFMNFNTLNSDFEINYKTNKIEFSKKLFSDWKVGVYNTGLASQTGSRIKKMKKF